jgi:hypothetical protein
VASLINTIGPRRAFGFLTRYLGHQMDRGTLRRMDPGVATRCFAGPIILNIFTREVFIQPDAETLAPETMVASAVELFLRAMAPEGAAQK